MTVMAWVWVGVRVGVLIRFMVYSNGVVRAKFKSFGVT